MKQIVVISGKGGTGKTVISASLAELSKNFVFADCDVDAADLHLLLKPDVVENHEFYSGKEFVVDAAMCDACGRCVELCRFGAVKKTKTSDGSGDKIKIDNFSCEGCGVCLWNCPRAAIISKQRFCGRWFVSETRYGPMVHAELSGAAENSGKLVSAVRSRARGCAVEKKSSGIIIDGPPGIGCPVIASVAGADLAVIVTEPSVSACHDMKRIAELLKHFAIPAKVVINRCDISPVSVGEIKKYCSSSEIEIAAMIPYSEEIAQSVAAGAPFVEYSTSAASREIHWLWETIKP
jgi:MinD superfamily P-loop ATPase